MGLFGSNNDCRYKDICTIAAVDGKCSHCHDASYTDCDIYQDYRDAYRNSTCPLKNECPDFPGNCIYTNNLDGCFRYQKYGEGRSVSIQDSSPRRSSSSSRDNHYTERNNDAQSAEKKAKSGSILGTIVKGLFKGIWWIIKQLLKLIGLGFLVSMSKSDDSN